MSAPELDARHAAAAGYASLLTSAGTLVCCALPALLVAVGAGAVLASAVSAMPALVWLSEYKGYVFSLAAVMLVIAGVMQWRARSLPCPADRMLAAACRRTRKLGLAIYLASVTLFCVGGFFAFVLPAMME
jgi:hypothetical protein